MFEMTNENFARLLDGLTIAVGNRKNRILFYQFLAAEIRALHYSYGVGDSESYKRALTFLEKCERLTLRSLIRNSAERHVEVTVDRAKSIFLRALEKLNAPSALSADLMPKGHGKRALMSYGPDTINIVRRSVRRSHPQGREARRPTRCRIRPSL